MSRNSKKKPTGNYPIGYAKPPAHGRWKPGQSGNPKGRPALSGDPAENAHKLFNEQIVVPLNGKPTRMTVGEAFVRQMMKAALAGNPTAIRQVLRLYEKIEEHKKTGGWTIIDARPILEENPPGHLGSFVNGVRVD